jgi:hypothetical protein
MKDEKFKALLKWTVRAVWEAFKVLVDNCLGKYRATNYRTLVENMLQTFRNTGCNMSDCNSFKSSGFLSKQP